MFAPIFIISILVVVRNIDSLKDTFLEDVDEISICPLALSPYDVAGLPKQETCQNEFTDTYQNPGPVWQEEGYRYILYTPDTPATNEVMKFVADQLELAGTPVCNKDVSFTLSWTSTDEDAQIYEAECDAAGGTIISEENQDECACIMIESRSDEDSAAEEANNGTIAALLVFDKDDPIPDSKRVKFDIRMPANLPSEGVVDQDGDRWHTRKDFPYDQIVSRSM